MENLSQLVALWHIVSLLVPGAKGFRCKKLLRAVPRLRGVMEIPSCLETTLPPLSNLREGFIGSCLKGIWGMF